MEGIYQCQIQTPMGKMEGKIILERRENELIGKIESAMIHTSFRNGKVEENTFEFSGNIQFLFGTIRYTAKGIVEGDDIKINIVSDKGNFEIVGKRQ